MLIPVGTSGERPDDLTNGLLRYNTDDNRFEGYSSGWKSLGGVSNISGDTHIEATESDELKFYTSGESRVAIDASGQVTIEKDVSMNSSLDVSNILNVRYRFGLNQSAPSYSVHIDAKDAMLIPVGLSSERPTTSTKGLLRYNESDDIFEGYSNGGWQELLSINVGQKSRVNASSNDEIVFQTNDVSRVVIDATGHVLIKEDISINGSLEVSGQTVFKKNVIIGEKDTNATEVSNNDVELTIYGDLRIKDGGNIIIEDTSNTTITQLQTEVRVTDQFKVENDGADTALIVKQNNTTYEDIAEFQDKSSTVFKIGKDGDTIINGTLDVSGKLNVTGSDITMKKQTTFNQDVSFHATINASVVNASMVTAPSLHTDSVFFDETNRSHGDIGQRGQMRYDASRNMYQVYSGVVTANQNSAIWSGLAAYKTEQPPALQDISFTNTNTSVTVTWDKFPEVYRDALDGTSYPVYMFTVLDVSYSDIDGDSGGWKTIFVGNGNYKTNPDLSFTFDATNTTRDISAGYDDIQFISKPQSHDTVFPDFTQDHSFNVRVYGVNYSRQQPNYVEISGVCLQPTGPPGKVEITSMIETQFGITMDVSFDLDGSTTEIETDTATIPIKSYEISYNLVQSNVFTTQPQPTDNSSVIVDIPGGDKISGISLPNLYPGAKYDIQISAKNTMNDASGEFSDVSQSDFTHVANNTNQYVTTDELNDVSPTGMSFNLIGSESLYTYCRLNTGSSTSLNERKIMNTKGKITISGTSSFYVNYNSQGKHIDDATTPLVYVEFFNNGVVIDASLTYHDSYNANGVITYLGVQFGTSSYQDAAIQANDEGFVYISTIDPSSSNIQIDGNFNASTDEYYISYKITGNGQKINGSVYDLPEKLSDRFFVDDHNLTGLTAPNSVENITPSLKVNPNTTTYLYGIPSVHTIDISYEYEVSNFAGKIIPYNNWSGNIAHLKLHEISKSGVYSFAEYYKSDVYNNISYTFNHGHRNNESQILNPGYYGDTTTDSPFKFEMYYLNNTSASLSKNKFESTAIDLSLNGTIFQDIVTEYTGDPIHIFNGHNDVSSTPIVVTSPTFATDYSSDISHMLFYFDGKFVSGGYYHTSNGVDIYPFDDWSDGFATNAQGQDYSIYSDTSYNGYKWIALDVSSHVIQDVYYNKLNLANFDINGTHYTHNTFGTDYVAYIYQEGKFGSLRGNRKTMSNWWDVTNVDNISDVDQNEDCYARSTDDSTHGYLYSAWNGSAGSNNIKPLYLVVGLPQNSTLNFTFS